MKERRVSQRIPLSIEVTYEDREAFISSFLSDVSGGGVFIATGKPLEVGTRMQICFHVPGVTDSFMATVTVVWVSGGEGVKNPGMGVRFDEMDPKERQRLDEFLEE